MTGLVIQSHTTPLPYDWLEDCSATVRAWANQAGCDYRWLDDELFDPLPGWILDKFSTQIVIATDIARLHAIRHALLNGFDPVVWLDCDFYVFEPERFVLPDFAYALGREVWVQADPKARLKVYRRVHNAFLMFRQGNSFLDFYMETATRLLEQVSGSVPPQFIGPKLLAALNNVCQLPVMERAAMISPVVLDNIARGSGPALDLFRAKSSITPAGANLCSSLIGKGNEEIARLHQAMSNLAAGILHPIRREEGPVPNRG